MTLSLASYSAESFEDQVSDVVELPSYLLSSIYLTPLYFCFKSSFYCRLAIPH